MVLSLFLSAVASIASTLTQCDVSRQNSGASQIDVYTHMVRENKDYGNLDQICIQYEECLSLPILQLFFNIVQRGESNPCSKEIQISYRHFDMNLT